MVNVSLFFFFKQKTAYELRISDWSSDVCSSDLLAGPSPLDAAVAPRRRLHRAFQAAIEALAPQLPDRLKQALESWEHAPGSCVRRSALAVGAGILFVGGQVLGDDDEAVRVDDCQVLAGVRADDALPPAKGGDRKRRGT